MRKQFVLCIAMLLAVANAVCFAEAVYLKNGKVVTGRIVEKNEQFIVLKSGEEGSTVKITIFSEDINAIESNEQYLNETASIPFQLLKSEKQFLPKNRPSFFEIPSKTDSKEYIKSLLVQDEQSKSERFYKRGIKNVGIDVEYPGVLNKQPKKGSLLPETSLKVEQKLAFQVVDLYYQKLTFDKFNFFISIKNTSKITIPSLVLIVWVNDVKVTSVLKLDNIKVGEEKEFDITHIYRAYKKLMKKKVLENGEIQVLRFKIFLLGTEEVEFEKTLFII